MIVPLVINTYPIDRIFIWTAKFKPNITFEKEKDCRFLQIIIKMDFKWFKSAKEKEKKAHLKKLNIFQF